jgi:hypothetical protein
LFFHSATSVEIVPSKSMTTSLAWKALLSSLSFQFSADGGMNPCL